MVTASDDSFRRAMSSLQAGMLNDAERHFNAVLRDQPEHVVALNLLSVVLSRLERHAEAERYIKSAIALDPNSDATFYSYGNILKSLKRYDEALTAYDKALALNPDLFEAWFDRGDILLELKRYDDALTAYDTVLARSPELAGAWVGRAKCFMALGQDSAALSCFEKVFRLQREYFKKFLLGPNKRPLAEDRTAFSGIDDKSEAHYGILNALQLLKPHKTIGFDKIRLGTAADGGYVQLNDFTDISRAFSFGISTDDSWDISLALRGIPVDQYDHSIPEAPTRHRLLNFNRRMISSNNARGAITLDEIVIPFARPGIPDLMLKIDIEGDEWDVLDQASIESLSRFAQIVCEFHDLLLLREPQFRMRAHRVFEKLANQFSVIHVHANNYGKYCNYKNKAIPDVLEVSYANRDRYKFDASNEQFPTSLDTPNNVYTPDINLGSFSFDDLARR